MHLGLDLGTGSVKAVLIDGAGTTRWRDSEAYEPRLVDDEAEIDPAVWWASCISLLARAPAELKQRLTGIGLSGQMHGTVLLDDLGAVLRPAILWPDRRAVDEVASFERFDEANPGVLANPLLPGMPGPVLLWLERHEPDVWARIEQVVAPKDWLRGALLGTTPSVSDHSDASASLLYDVSRGTWSTDVRDMIGGLATALPDLRASTAVAGSTGREAERQLGIPARTPVAVGAGDAAAALLGSGIEHPGTVLLNVGTGAQALTIVPHPDERFVASGLHQYRAVGTEAPWYVMASVVNAGLVLGWVRRLFGFGWDELYQLAEDALDGHLSPTFAPFLAGERDARIGLDARAVWSGLSSGHGADDLARSALVGVASYLAHRTLGLMEVTGSTRLILSGGSMRNQGWVQLLADLLGRSIEVADDKDLSVRGAAILAARATGSDLASATTSLAVAPRPGRAAAAQHVMDRLATSLRTSAGNELEVCIE